MSSEILDVVAKNLKRLRQDRRMSQSDIAEVIGVSFQQVQKYENGKNRMPVDKLYRLARLYEISMDDFFAGL